MPLLYKLFTFCLTLSSDSDDTPRPKTSLEAPQGQGRIRALDQIRALGPEDDLAGVLLQVMPPPPLYTHLQYGG